MAGLRSSAPCFALLGSSDVGLGMSPKHQVAIVLRLKDLGCSSGRYRSPERGPLGGGGPAAGPGHR